jgi:translation initiation factor 2A
MHQHNSYQGQSQGQHQQQGRQQQGQPQQGTPQQGRQQQPQYQTQGNQEYRGANGGGVSLREMNNLSINMPPQAAPELSVTSPGGGSPSAKKLRGLQKKIRAIEDLEMRLAGGEKLEDTQMKKIGTKSSVQAELSALDHE